MGVLICNRGDCENIMCDYYSKEYGYICQECLNELVSKGIKTDIESFMRSTKGNERPESVRLYFESIFERQN